MLRARAFLLMFGWLLLFGCDDDEKTATRQTPSGQVTYVPDDPGCDDDVNTGTMTTPNGERYKVRIEKEEYVVAGAFVAVTLALSMCLLAGRREVLA